MIDQDRAPRLAELTYEELERLDKARLVVVLPVGATEAHGPHLPLSTDVIIAEAMAERASSLLAAEGVEALILPSLAYSVADFACGFAGTISLRVETAVALLTDIGRGLARSGLRYLAIANAHLDPEHLGSLQEAARVLSEAPPGEGLKVIFPNIARRVHAATLTEEFQSGACHAGQFEGSIVLARAPELVRDAIRLTLPPNPSSLSTAIRSGLRSFEEAGGPRAYFGSPADASAEEGEATIEQLGVILRDAVLAAL